MKLKPKTDDMGFVYLPGCETAIVGYQYPNQAAVYDVNTLRSLLAYKFMVPDEELQGELDYTVREAKLWSGITPLFIFSNEDLD